MNVSEKDVKFACVNGEKDKKKQDPYCKLRQKLRKCICNPYYVYLKKNKK